MAHPSAIVAGIVVSGYPSSLPGRRPGTLLPRPSPGLPTVAPERVATAAVGSHATAADCPIRQPELLGR